MGRQMRINSARQIVNILPLISLLLEAVVVIFASFAHKQPQQWVELGTHTHHVAKAASSFIHSSMHSSYWYLGLYIDH